MGGKSKREKREVSPTQEMEETVQDNNISEVERSIVRKNRKERKRKVESESDQSMSEEEQQVNGGHKSVSDMETDENPPPKKKRRYSNEETNSKKKLNRTDSYEEGFEVVKRKKSKKKKEESENSDVSEEEIERVYEKPKRKAVNKLNESSNLEIDPVMSREEWKKKSDDYKLYIDSIMAGESLFDETLRKMAECLSGEEQADYVNFRFVSKISNEKIFWWMYNLIIDKKLSKEVSQLIEHALEGMRIRQKEITDMKEGKEQKLTAEEIQERNLKYQMLQMSNIQKGYKEKIVYKSEQLNPFTFYINIGKSWYIKSDFMKMTSTENEFFPVVLIVKASSDPTQKKPYSFSMTTRQVSIITLTKFY